jgi:hypothetical protein
LDALNNKRHELMDGKPASIALRLLVTATFVTMVVVNVLANTIPLNGRQTGEVSDLYGNLFAPAGITFAIWGVIYVLLGLHVLYQWGAFHRADRLNAPLLGKIGTLFSVSSVANTLWIFAWHYDFIWLSALLIISILVLLILITRELRTVELTKREELFLRMPFSVYFGWITVATVANITAWLVSINWSGWGLSEPVWAVAIIAIAAAIGTATMLRNQDITYGLVLLWAFLGILLKHTMDTGFAGKYPEVIVTTIACLAVFVAGEARIMLRTLRRAAWTGHERGNWSARKACWFATRTGRSPDWRTRGSWRDAVHIGTTPGKFAPCSASEVGAIPSKPERNGALVADKDEEQNDRFSWGS